MTLKNGGGLRGAWVLVCALALTGLAACDSDPDDPDTGTPVVDGGVDGGVLIRPDGGQPMPDGGPVPMDGGPPPDGGTDAGPPGVDAGPPPGGGAATSAQIAAVRAIDEGDVDQDPPLPVTDAIVTEVLIADLDTGIRGGFFVQAEQEGPALYVEVLPFTLPFTPEVGDIVSFDVLRAEETFSRQHQVTSIANLTRSESGVDIEFLIQDITDVDVLADLDDYESEIVRFRADIDEELGLGGCGYSSLACSTADTSGITGGSIELVAEAETLVRADATPGCEDIVVGPTILFRDASTPQALILREDQLTFDEVGPPASTCPGPSLIDVDVVDAETLVLTFDRRISPASVVGPLAFDLFGIEPEINLSEDPVRLSDDQRSLTIEAVERMTDLRGSGLAQPGVSHTLTVLDTRGGGTFAITDRRGEEVDLDGNVETFIGYDNALVINEISYATSGRQFIEIYNPTDETISFGSTSVLVTERLTPPGGMQSDSYASTNLAMDDLLPVGVARELAPGEYLVLFTGSSSASFQSELTIRGGSTPFLAATGRLTGGFGSLPELNGTADGSVVLLRSTGSGRVRCADSFAYGIDRTEPFSRCAVPLDSGLADPGSSGSIARATDGTGAFEIRATATPGAAN